MIENFLNQYSVEREQNEKIRGERELRLIQLANEAIADFFQKYGIKVAKIPPEVIHFYDRKAYPGSDESEGCVTYKKVRINILDDVSEVPTFLRIVHEMVHMVSATAFQLRHTDGVSEIYPYRSGISVTNADQEVKHLRNTNEAVTEEITIAIYRKVISKGLFQKELAASEKHQAKFREKSDTPPIPEETIFGRLDDQSGRLDVYFHSYEEQRSAFKQLVESLSKCTSLSQKEVFEEFVRAYASGNLLGIARRIESVFGRGSWKKFVEYEKDPKRLIESLKTFADGSNSL